ncbi:hypothetical protein [Magnetospirillum gryphiswaldense]|nr:hypothetical protein [Magnetospirillum gryphiswaldense]AVM72541.1 hypothetical protein MSR1_00110 [Magnetospirillum gryphiswaldense MSR-1]AVM76444.1 hypothetical protein MSR1L_00110 [Magnetospirillum gryphiswaldense]
MTSPDPGGSNAVPSFAVLAARYLGETDQPDVTLIDFAAVLSGGPDPSRILPYLTGLGLPWPETLTALHDTINALEDEEELHAWMVAEGVAVSVASDGIWFLFV